ncbi:hypothetical protein CD351_02480 [Erythrobacter sp. KY5]|uniref:PAS domain-containing protein n=1 Tax=Erythrobacter sp. KY5 TaxID=2011159 RepID=UPI000DBF2C09|nr:hypothetical protein CD351_02480 [Erythrobacter sp. KY5]
MDNLRGTFDSELPADDSDDWGADTSVPDEEAVRELPPEAIGQDERRMQVRAYNHWASLLGEATFPSIEDLEPQNLTDFGPNSVLLDFSAGIEDPVVQYLGDRLAEECGTDDIAGIKRLSDVPPRSLLSRITDHYMQILANQAPIGFEAEFVNQRGSSILYRGILLPFSSDDETIDFIYGVINWKEMADAATADELLLEIDQAIEHGDAQEPAIDEDTPQKHHSDPLTEWADAPSHESLEEAEQPELHDIADIDEDPAALANVARLGSDMIGDNLHDDDQGDDMPFPDFGHFSLDDEDELDEYGEPIEDEDEGASYSFASLSDYIDAPAKKAVDLDAELFDPEDYKVDHADQPVSEPVSQGGDESEDTIAKDIVESDGIIDPLDLAGLEVAENTDENDGADTIEGAIGEAGGISAEEPSEEPLDLDEVAAFEPEPQAIKAPVALDDAQPSVQPAPEAVAAPVAAPQPAEDIAACELAEDADLYDCLAAARELAQTASVSEDRTRSALYAAVGRAYDFSLAAKDEPQAYEELIEESGLTVQDRAPMTPIVKLVFGHDYDKTRLTEYAAVLSHAHRIGLERGRLAGFLGEADGGLKGVVAAERRLRREEAGKEVEAEGDVRAQLAQKLRELEELTLEALSGEGPEFSLVMVRRDGKGNVALIGEIDDDVKLIERAGKRLVG